MRELFRVCASTVVSGVSFVYAYKFSIPLFTAILLWMSGEPASNVELADSYARSWPIFGAAIVCAAAVGFTVNWTMSGLLKQYIPERRKPETAIEMSVYTLEATENGTAAETQIFESLIQESLIDGILAGNLDTAVDLTSGDTTVSLNRGPSSAHPRLETCQFTIMVTVKRGARVLHAFETVIPGRFWSPEGKPYCFCRYELVYIGCSDNVQASILFKGPIDSMRRIFTSG